MNRFEVHSHTHYSNLKGLDCINRPKELILTERTIDEKFDVILLDFFMPEMTGEEFLIRLREFNTETIIINIYR